MFVCFFKSRFVILKARVQANCSFRLAHLHASEIFVHCTNSYALMNVNCIFLKQKIIPPHLKIKENLLQLIEKKEKKEKKTVVISLPFCTFDYTNLSSKLTLPRYGLLNLSFIFFCNESLFKARGISSRSVYLVSSPSCTDLDLLTRIKKILCELGEILNWR